MEDEQLLFHTYVKNLKRCLVYSKLKERNHVIDLKMELKSTTYICIDWSAVNGT